MCLLQEGKTNRVSSGAQQLSSQPPGIYCNLQSFINNGNILSGNYGSGNRRETLDGCQDRCIKVAHCRETGHRPALHPVAIEFM
jgi:hypothetical protein